MSIRYKSKRRLRYYVQRKRCQICGEPAIECRIEWWNKRPDEMLCPAHARAAGYCVGCGMFWAGATSFDMRGTGLCDHCQAQLDADFSDGCDDDSAFWDDFGTDCAMSK